MDCNLSGNIESVLLSEGRYISTTKGVSMLPMIKTGRDVVIVEPKNGRLKKYDVALYRRGEAYVLHRVVEVTDEGYIIRGDNTYADEVVPEADVFGVLTEYYRGKKLISVTDEKYQKYAEKRVKSYPQRRKRYLFKRKIKNFIKKIIGRK